MLNGEFSSHETSSELGQDTALVLMWLLSVGLVVCMVGDTCPVIFIELGRLFCPGLGRMLEVGNVL